MGEVPLHQTIRENSDAGKPVVANDPNGPHAMAYRKIAENLWKEIEIRQSSEDTAMPKIVVE